MVLGWGEGDVSVPKLCWVFPSVLAVTKNYLQ